MTSRTSINLSVQTAAACGVAGYLLSWLLHLFIKSFLRSASPYVIEGSAAAVCGGVSAALLGLYVSRSFASSGPRGCLCLVAIAAIPLLIAAEGISGMIVVSYIMDDCKSRLSLRANLENEVIPWGYHLMPILWTAILRLVTCWHYKARRRCSLLEFDSASAEVAAPGGASPLNRELHFAAGSFLCCGLVTWLVHRNLASRHLASVWGTQSTIEAAPLILMSGITGTLGFLYASRVLKGRLSSVSVCALITLIVGLPTGFSGAFGYSTAMSLILVSNSSLDRELAAYGYYIFPMAWTVVLAWGLCWSYEATHGGASLLDLEPPEVD